MPPVDRRNPIRAGSSESSCYLLEFIHEYPDDEACLLHLWTRRYAPDGEHAECPRCDATRKFKRYPTKDKRPAWYRQTCGFRIHPLKGTIFERSSTSLQLWYYAMYLITSTRCGISAKHLERELGVPYKAAWRMFNRIRNHLMIQDELPLSGSVEADETFVGGRPREADKRRGAALGWNPQTDYWQRKAVVFGAVERGGRIRAEVVPDSRLSTIVPKVQSYILPGSMVF